MSTPIRASDRDLRALAAFVSQDREAPPADYGLPPSLLTDLMSQIRCDIAALKGIDVGRQAQWFVQGNPGSRPPSGWEDLERVYWTHYRASPPFSYASRTGDLRSVIKHTDFYSARQWHSTAMYTDFARLAGHDHSLWVFLPEAPPGTTAGPERQVRLSLSRESGPDFSERDRAVLTLLRPHLHQAYRAAEQHRHPAPRLTPRQNELLRLLAAGHTNTQIARQLGISEGTVRTHLENIYDKLGVSSRTAAVTRAFPDRAVQDPPASARPADQATLVIPARSTGRRYSVRGPQKET